MHFTYHTSVIVTSKTCKGQVFFRRLLLRQTSIIKGFSVTRLRPLVI